MQPISVTDARSSSYDQIEFAARVVGRSKLRRRVFEEIYKGKKKQKTITELVDETKLERKQVLNEAKKLAKNQIVRPIKIPGQELAYAKDDFYQHHKAKILSLAGNRKKLDAFPTKVNPKSRSQPLIKVSFPRKRVRVKHITIDDFSSFSLVRRVKPQSVPANSPFGEEWFKKGFQEIIGERGKFKDWGGESSDLFTSRMTIKQKRYPLAIGFKGKGLRVRKLTPKHMGKNGDQIQRLFREPADIFMVQYWAQIDASVVEQLSQFAIAASVLLDRQVYYGVIDGTDSQRLLKAYPKAFGTQ